MIKCVEKIIKKSNTYFFDEEKICLSDSILFYGFIAFMLLVTVTAVIPAQIQLWMVK